MPQGVPPAASRVGACAIHHHAHDDAMRSTIAGPRSRALFAAASRRIPGGVNSPVRAFKRLGGRPPVMVSGKGSRITDADGRSYIDYVLSWGPLVLGHAHPAVVKAVIAAAKRGLSFGAPTPAEGRLAEILCGALPGMDQVRLVSSGTEATMSALRVARAATGRDLIVKCDGCYHGHADYLLVAAGSGCATLGQPDSAGVPKAFADHTISLPYNDLEEVERTFKRHRGRIAAFIIEPVAGNMGLVLPEPGYLAGLRGLCTTHGVLLVFDEVMTGFRAAWGGYQRVCGVRPDLTCLGKVIGGGLAVGAYGGRRELMAQVAPLGPCYQAGTLSGNPVAVAAGIASLKILSRNGLYQKMAARLTVLLQGLRNLAEHHGVAIQFAQAGTMWGFFFSDRPVRSFADALATDTDAWRRFCLEMYRQGVYLAPSPFEAAFWSLAHGSSDIEATLAAADHAFAACG
jgi:glutamate-1-semialdehyde 2,1-aminomutase